LFSYPQLYYEVIYIYTYVDVHLYASYLINIVKTDGGYLKGKIVVSTTLRGMKTIL